MKGAGTFVPHWQDWLGWAVAAFPHVFVRLGNLETRICSENIAAITIDRPIYVAGLARSGSTLILECLASHPEIATHRYRDFPLLFVPVWWNWFIDQATKSNTQYEPVERAHKDRIKVTPESPEAMEEMLWMAFFPHVHDPARNNALGASVRNKGFEAFYADHMRKLMSVRGGARYLSKENYNVSRLLYLQKMFPDVRVVVPFRDPVGHIASLMKQHRLFHDAEMADRKVLRYMNRIGHFEFGLGRCPINPGDSLRVAEIQALWERGDEVLGWSKYWALVYGAVADDLERHDALRDSVMVVHYDGLCRSPRETLQDIYNHCQLDITESHLSEQAERVSYPSYYSHQFTDADLECIMEETSREYGRVMALAGPSTARKVVGESCNASEHER